VFTARFTQTKFPELSRSMFQEPELKQITTIKKQLEAKRANATSDSSGRLSAQIKACTCNSDMIRISVSLADSPVDDVQIGAKWST
jgi:hypothetical protein